MIPRNDYMNRLATALRRSPITALLGPRQSGKTTLARSFSLQASEIQPATFFDLESMADQRRLDNPELVLGSLQGLIVLDEIQQSPKLFSVLRVLVDRPNCNSRFLILGSASPELIKGASQTLAGRIEFIELPGLELTEVGSQSLQRLWLRGGFPRSFISDTDMDSWAWRNGFIQTFLQRDIPQMGIALPAPAMHRFWTMLAHVHGQTWNSSDLARSLGQTDKTIRRWLDVLTGTYMVRQLQPWFENLGKRQVKAPKVFLRDSGLLHSLLGVTDLHGLHGHPKVGASWEGFAIEQLLVKLRPEQCYFWATHGGAELDLMMIKSGQRIGVEVKFQEAPLVTKSMRIAISDLGLDQLWIIYPGTTSYPVDDRIHVRSLSNLAFIAEEFSSLGS